MRPLLLAATATARASARAYALVWPLLLAQVNPGALNPGLQQQQLLQQQQRQIPAMPTSQPAPLIQIDEDPDATIERDETKTKNEETKTNSQENKTNSGTTQPGNTQAKPIAPPADAKQTPP